MRKPSRRTIFPCFLAILCLAMLFLALLVPSADVRIDRIAVQPMVLSSPDPASGLGARRGLEEGSALRIDRRAPPPAPPQPPRIFYVFADGDARSGALAGVLSRSPELGRIFDLPSRGAWGDFERQAYSSQSLRGANARTRDE